MSRPADADHEIRRALRLREAPPPVARLSRRTLALLAVVSGLVIAGVAAWAIGRHVPSPAAVSSASAQGPDSATPPEALATLPRDYSTPPAGVPKLGPPLPGDIGRPLLDAKAGAGDQVAQAAGGSAPDPELQQALALARQARASPLAAPTTSRPPPDHEVVRRDPPVRTAAAGVLPMSPHAPGIEDAASAFVIQAGSTIRAALITGVSSDTPGEVIAQVTEDVFDSPTGRWKLIPQGSRLIGTYNDKLAFGQTRLQLAWTRLILPGGRSVPLGSEPAAGAAGEAGLMDGVDHHWSRLLGAAFISTLTGVGADLGLGHSDGALGQALSAGLAGSANQAGQQLIGRTLDMRPVVTLRPGLPVRVLVTHDLVLEPAP